MFCLSRPPSFIILLAHSLILLVYFSPFSFCLCSPVFFFVLATDSSFSFFFSLFHSSMFSFSFFLSFLLSLHSSLLICFCLSCSFILVLLSCSVYSNFLCIFSALPLSLSIFCLSVFPPIFVFCIYFLFGLPSFLSFSLASIRTLLNDLPFPLSPPVCVNFSLSFYIPIYTSIYLSICLSIFLTLSFSLSLSTSPVVIPPLFNLNLPLHPFTSFPPPPSFSPIPPSSFLRPHSRLPFQKTWNLFFVWSYAGLVILLRELFALRPEQ